MQHPTSVDIQRVREFLLDLQARICAGLEQQERAGGGTAEFIIDDWQRTEGGGGRSRVLQNVCNRASSTNRRRESTSVGRIFSDSSK